MLIPRLFIFLYNINNFKMWSDDISTSAFSIFQLNTLAKNLCDTKSFPMIEKEYLEWNYRLTKFEEIFNKEEHDIYCLEEVDTIYPFINIINKKKNFNFIHHLKKVGAPGGLAVFYNNIKFELMYNDLILLKLDNTTEKGSKEMAVLILKDIKTDSRFCLFTVHLKAKKDKENERMLQVISLFNYINSKAFKEIYVKYKCKGIILAGDFNSSPDFNIIPYILKQSINLNCQTEDNNKLSIFNSQFISAFEIENEKNDYVEFTTVKSRDKFYCCLIDYILYTKGSFKVKNKYRAYEGKKVENFKPYGLPNKNYPSDHLYLVTEFII